MDNKKKIYIGISIALLTTLFFVRRKNIRAKAQTNIAIGKIAPFGKVKNIEEKRNCEVPNVEQKYNFNLNYFSLKEKPPQNEQFMRDFNVISDNIRNTETSFSEFRNCKDSVNIGERSSDVKKLESVLNEFLKVYTNKNITVLDTKANYSNEIFEAAKMFLKNTSFFNTNTGAICKASITDLYIFLFN